jgi:hypothetical protein
MEVYDNLSDSGKIESADDDSRFEPTDADSADNDNNNVDDDDEGANGMLKLQHTPMILTLATTLWHCRRKEGANPAKLLKR